MMRLLLLPGFDGTGRLFRPLLNALPSDIEASVIEYSAEPSQDQSYSALIEFVERRMGTTPFVLLGESFSGPISVEIAARHPERVQGLILAATFLEPPWPATVIRTSARFSHRLVPRAVMQRVLMGRWKDGAIKTEIDRIARELPSETVRARLHAIAGCDVRSRIADVRCPILALTADRDLLVSSRSVRLGTERSDRARIRRLPGPHMLLQCNPTAAAREIAAFMRDVSTTP